MKVTVAIDSYKGSLSTFEAGEAASLGIKLAFPDCEIAVRPLADGGEGTVRAVVSGAGGALRKVSVSGPLGERVEAEYGVIEKTATAVIEMSAAAGITLVSEKEKNPLNTTTFGVGEIISDAISLGLRKFIIGIGGSATNDGGVGMLEALGFEFLDGDGNQIERGAKGLKNLKKIETKRALPALSECEFKIACDVKNPLCGDEGCSAIYGPQKGATKEMIRDMDLWLDNYARLTKEVFVDADPTYPGAGAAGGMGFAALAYLGGSLESGIELVMKETSLEKYINDSDIVVTGEGRLDGQSCMGKAPIGVARLAKKHKKPVIAFSGCVTDDARLTNENGIDAFFPIVRGAVSLEDAMNTENAAKNLKMTAEQAFRLVRTFLK